MGTHWQSSAESEQAPPEPPSPITFVLQAPFTERDTSAIGIERYVDLDQGAYFVLSGAALASSESSENGIGHFFRPLENFNRLKVTGAVSNADVHLAAAGMGGVGHASASSILQILKEGRVVCDQRFDHGSVLSVAMWISEDEHGDQFSINCIIRNQSSNNDLSLKLTTKTENTAVGLATSLTSVDVDVRKIEIKFFNQ